MDNLQSLQEASILDNIQHRFRMDLIYTNTGPILIAMNLFKCIGVPVPLLRVETRRVASTAPRRRVTFLRYVAAMASGVDAPAVAREAPRRAITPRRWLPIYGDDVIGATTTPFVELAPSLLPGRSRCVFVAPEDQEEPGRRDLWRERRR